MNAKNTYSFTDILSVIVGSVIGVGIFYKVNDILTKTNNIWLAIISWLVGLLIVIGLTFGFMEAQLTSNKKNQAGTLSSWSNNFVSKWFGKFTGIFMTFIYFPTFAILCVFYATQFIFMAAGINIETSNQMSGISFGVTFVMWITLCLGNIASYKFGPKFQKLGTVIKFIPLLAVMILGLFFPMADNGGSFAGVVGTKVATWDWRTILIALPGVFFALDGWFFGLAFSKEERRKGDSLKATIIGTLAICVFYILFAVALGYGTTDGNLFSLFNHTFGKLGAKILLIIISVSAITVGNGMIIAGQRQAKELADENSFFRIKSIEKTTKDGRFVGQGLLIFVHGLIHLIIFYAAGLAFGEISYGAGGYFKGVSSIVNEWGNAMTVLAFLVFAFINIGVWKNTLKANQNKNTKIAGVAGIITTVIILYQAWNYIKVWNLLSWIIIATSLMLIIVTQLAYSKLK